MSQAFTPDGHSGPRTAAPSAAPPPRTAAPSVSAAIQKFGGGRHSQQNVDRDASPTPAAHVNYTGELQLIPHSGFVEVVATDGRTTTPVGYQFGSALYQRGPSGSFEQVSEFSSNGPLRTIPGYDAPLSELTQSVSRLQTTWMEYNDLVVSQLGTLINKVGAIDALLEDANRAITAAERRGDAVTASEKQRARRLELELQQHKVEVAKLHDTLDTFSGIIRSGAVRGGELDRLRELQHEIDQIHDAISAMAIDVKERTIGAKSTRPFRSVSPVPQAPTAAGEFGMRFGYTPGVRVDFPPGQSIRPRTLLRYMQLTFKAYHPHENVPSTFVPGDVKKTGYIPHIITPTGDVLIPGGWSRNEMVTAVARNLPYTGSNPVFVPNQQPFGKYVVDQLESRSAAAATNAASTLGMDVASVNRVADGVAEQTLLFTDDASLRKKFPGAFPMKIGSTIL